MRVAIQFGQIVEGIRPAQLAGGDQAHEHVAHVSTVRSLVKQRIPSVTNCLFQRPLADVIVQRCPGHAQKQRQLLPVPKQVRDGFPQSRVGLHPPLVELLDKPDMEFLHDRTALGLVEEQPLVGR